MNWLMVFLGGGLGSLARYSLSHLNSFSEFPMGTIFTNALACLLLGYVAAKSQSEANLNPYLVLFFATGFCGGFSTFSTFSVESILLAKNNLLLLSIANIFLSIIIGLISIVVGMKLYTTYH